MSDETNGDRHERLRVAMRRLDKEGPLPGMIAAFENNFGASWTDPEWRSEASIWAAAWRLVWSSRAVETRDGMRYRWLRERDLDTIDKGGVFAGLTPANRVLNGTDLDDAIDAALAAGSSE